MSGFASKLANLCCLQTGAVYLAGIRCNETVCHFPVGCHSPCPCLHGASYTGQGNPPTTAICKVSEREAAVRETTHFTPEIQVIVLWQRKGACQDSDAIYRRAGRFYNIPAMVSPWVGQQLTTMLDGAAQMPMGTLQ